MPARLPIKSDVLWLITVGFLALPVGIFAICWLSPVWAVLLICFLAAGIHFRPESNPETPVSISWWSVLLLACGCIGICVAAGVGGFAYQDGDYFKHNAILADLFRRDWPVAYQIEHERATHSVALVYYLAYYLPSALVGKLAGWEALRYSMVLWTAGGMLLMAFWCLRLAKGALWAPLAFLAFGGFDMIGMILGLKVFSWMPELWIAHRQMEWWAGFNFGNFPSHSNHLFWAPQHALPGWLVVAAVLNRIRAGSLGGCLLPVALSILWSPFIALGMIPIGLAGLLISRGKGAFTWSNLASIPVIAVGALYIASRGVPEIPFEEIPNEWNDLNKTKLLLTFVLETLPWTLLLLWSFWSFLPEKLITLTCAMFLSLLPLWRLGAFNDLMMRSSLPAFSALSLLLLAAATSASHKWRMAGLAALVLGAGGFAFDLVRHVEFTGGKASQVNFSSPDRVPTIPETPDLSGLLDQYLGTPKSVFASHLARPFRPPEELIPHKGQRPPAGVLEKQDRMQKDLRRRFEEGERTPELLTQYGTVSYFQGNMWESMLAMETMVKVDPGDPNARIRLAGLLASSGIHACRERARSEFNAARLLAEDPAQFDRLTIELRRTLESTK